MSWLENLEMLGSTQDPIAEITGSINFLSNCVTGTQYDNYQRLGLINFRYSKKIYLDDDDIYLDDIVNSFNKYNDDDYI